MIDKYKELSENLSVLVNIIIEFDSSKDDYKKPDIRAYQIKLSNLAKIIDGQVKEDTLKFINIVDEYLANPQKNNYAFLIEKAIKLNNDLWEL